MEMLGFLGCLLVRRISHLVHDLENFVNGKAVGYLTELPSCLYWHLVVVARTENIVVSW